MKAILLAGGEGTRLRPMTCRVPKPMVRLFDEPILAHTLRWLSRMGVTEAAVTLRYLPFAVREYFGGEAFGIRLTYFTETEPLGTAGAVKTCEAFCAGETALVVSGDGVCDFDLAPALEFHAAKDAEVTMILYSHPEPLPYGIVRTDVRDRIIGFAEKPAWGEVFTDRVNTGIYLLSPAAFRRIPAGRPFDFSRDLFPAMLRADAGLFGLCLPGYWRDLGDPAAYLACVRDALEGRVKLARGPERTELPEGVALEGPCYLSRDAEIGPDCRIGPRAVLLPGAKLGRGCTVADSVIAGELGPGTEARGAVTDRGSLAETGASLAPGCVVGAGARLGAGVQLAPGVAVWPEVTVEPGCRVDASISDGGRWLPREGEGALSGRLGCEMTPAFFLRLGCALARDGGCVLLSGEPLWAILAMGAGVSSAGAECLAADAGFPAAGAMAASLYGARVAADVRLSEDEAEIRLFDGRGLPLSRAETRRILARLAAGAEPSAVRPGRPPRRIEGCGELYLSLAARRFPCAGAKAGARPGSTEAKALALAGAAVTADGEPFFALSPDGFSFTVRHGTERLDRAHAQAALYAALFLDRRRTVAACPGDAPALLDRLAAHTGGKLLRAGRDEGAEEALAGRPECLHGLFGILCLCSILTRRAIGLSDLAAGIPTFVQLTREIPAAGGRAACMQRLIRAFPDAETAEGLRMPVGEDSVSVRPSPLRDSLTVTAEARDAEFAEELCANIERVIRSERSASDADER